MEFLYSVIYDKPYQYDGGIYQFDPTIPVPVPPDHEHYGMTLQQIHGIPDADAASIVLTEKWRQIRAFRDKALASCDWTQGADVPNNIKQPWAAYRAALRDLPTQFETPDDVVFPDKPE
jgi:hypothetical protein